MAQYVYTMNRVGKVVPPKKTILQDISLSFFPGAKIGVLGLNGSGKSTLLRIMAGSTATFWARRGRSPASRSVTCRRSRSSIRTRTCAAMWKKACRSHRRAGRAGEGLRRLRRTGCRLRRAGQGAGPAGGHHPGDRRAQPGSQAGSRRRRPAPAALGRRRQHAVGR